MQLDKIRNPGRAYHLTIFVQHWLC